MSEIAHPLAAPLAQQREMIAAAGRKAETQGGYLTACETALRFVQSPELAAALAALPGGGVDGCEWSYDDDSYSWDSACGEKFCFNNDGPKENGFKFCHGCGKPVAPSPTPNPHEADRNG